MDYFHTNWGIKYILTFEYLNINIFSTNEWDHLLSGYVFYKNKRLLINLALIL